MIDFYWVDIIFIVLSLFSLIIFLKTAYFTKSLSGLFFSFSILSLLISDILFFLVNVDAILIAEWGNLVSIIFVFCALLVEIRNSKPILARFPFPLVFFPLIGLIFFPIVNQADVIKNLLISMYQVGAIIVGLLVISINQLIHNNRFLLLISCLLFVIAYFGFWIFDNLYFKPITIILTGFGMLFGALGFKKMFTNQNNINHL